MELETIRCPICGTVMTVIDASVPHVILRCASSRQEMKADIQYTYVCPKCFSVIHKTHTKKIRL
jgi:predicted RNA-binding Zn-ribbon protein involved in translation (DUF1610 family)